MLKKSNFVIFICAISLAACGLDEVPTKQEVTYDSKEPDTTVNPGGEENGEKDGEDASPVLLHEVVLPVAERKTQEYFCLDYSSFADCQLDWQEYLEKDLVFQEFEFKLALAYDNGRLVDVACGFRSPDGQFFPGEFSNEHGICFAYYDDYSGDVGRYDLFLIDEEYVIPGNFILFMFDSVSVHIVDGESRISFSHEYKSGKQQYHIL